VEAMGAAIFSVLSARGDVQEGFLEEYVGSTARCSIVTTNAVEGSCSLYHSFSLLRLLPAI
jgi:hypothetical protein